MTKASLDPHFGRIENRMEFEAAWRHIQTNPNVLYQTTGNGTPFTAHATRAKRGQHPGEQVIIFRTNGSERARAYPCCWGHKTNCNRTHIDCYTLAV